MPNFNQVIIIGHATRDPELKHLQSGTAVCNIGIAVTEKFKSGNEWKEETCFVDVEFWGRTAEVAAEYLAKGEPFQVCGKLKLQRWEKDGQKHYKHSIKGDSMQLLSRNSSPPDDSSQQETRQRPASKPKQQRQKETVPPPDEDVPF